MKIETIAIHAGRTIDPGSGAVTPPLVTSTTFERAPDGGFPHGYVYTRSGNPNRTALERCMAELEGGTDAIAFSSGSAATAAVFQTLSPGDHVIVSDDLYYGTRTILRELLEPWGLEWSSADLSDPDALRRAIRPTTRLVWVESPSNPRLKIADIALIAAIAHDADALCACDNTWGTPALQRPLRLGADIAVHSTTKYLGGHSDLLGGCVVTGPGAPADRLRTVQKVGGAVPSPFDCWLLLRGISTLPYRMAAHSDNAIRIARFLRLHPRVTAVHYPGLPDHPGHSTAVRQMRRFGGMLSFQVAGGASEAMAVAARVRLFIRATSLGGVESLIEHRASVEGKDSPTPVNLLRLSVGLEHVDDLIADLDDALR